MLHEEDHRHFFVHLSMGDKQSGEECSKDSFCEHIARGSGRHYTYSISGSVKLTPGDYRSGSRVMLSRQDFKHLGRNWSILVWPRWCWRKKMINFR